MNGIPRAVLYTSTHHTSSHGNQLFPARQSDKGPEGAMETPETVTEACWQVTATPSFAHVASSCTGQHPQQQNPTDNMHHARLIATICSAEVSSDWGPMLWSLLIGGAMWLVHVGLHICKWSLHILLVSKFSSWKLLWQSRGLTTESGLSVWPHIHLHLSVLGSIMLVLMDTVFLVC